GTGGHVYPGLALAEALVARGHPRESVHWVGSAGKLEETAVPAAGFTIDVLPGRGLQRRLTVENIPVLFKSARAFGQAVRIVGRTKPAVVVGVGGYASLPCLVAARLHHIPVVVHEQNAAPGLANRIAVRLGARAAVSLPGTPLAGAVVTGNPVRSSVVAVERRPSPERPLVAVFGGSPGAPGDHQTRNAEALVAAGAALLVPDAECTGARLAAELEPLLADPGRLEAMSAAARTLARPNAADALADLVEETAGRRNGRKVPA